MSTTKRTRTQTIDEAKALIIANGPSNALEFAAEWRNDEGVELEFDTELLTEVKKQARRVYEFLGYNPPANW